MNWNQYGYVVRVSENALLQLCQAGLEAYSIHPPPARELCRLGQEIYERDLKAKLEPKRNGEHVVIHVVNGDYAVDPDERRAYDTMREKYPYDVFFFARIGWDAAEGFGGRGLS